jgi:uncharacterized protein YydD (DUF2326 family)
LRQAIKAGELGTIFGTSGEIRPELVRTEERVVQLKSRIDNFRVLGSYREMADQVSQIKSRISELAVDLALVNETIAYLTNSIREEKPPAYAAVETLYSAAGIQLPEVALRRFDEVREFQHSVVSNRRRYLEEEIEAARTTQQTLETELASADDRKSEILVILDGKGAFEDLMAMHEEFAANSNRADPLKCGHRFVAARDCKRHVKLAGLAPTNVFEEHVQQEAEQQHLQKWKEIGIRKDDHFPLALLDKPDAILVDAELLCNSPRR